MGVPKSANDGGAIVPMYKQLFVQTIMIRYESEECIHDETENQLQPPV